MTAFVGLDQHRAQITAEWLDTATGEVSRARVMPADREGVRRFLSRFAGRDLEVALEATTGWRFVVEELRAIGAQVHQPQPAETSARRGNNKRAKTDWADARHLRELLMVDRLPESWIPPDHLLDLRAQVRLRHALINQRGEWLQASSRSSTTTGPPRGAICAPARTANLFLRGFAAYFRYGNSAIKLAQLSRYAAERLALFVGKRHKRGRRGGWQRLVASPSRMGLVSLSGITIAPRPRRPWREQSNAIR